MTKQNKYKPILFSTPMVEAILDGRKTMTRRIVKSKHESGLFQVCRRKIDGQITEIASLDWDERPKNDCCNDIKPKYKIGNILWTKETFYAYGWWMKRDYKSAFVDTTMHDKHGEYHYETCQPDNVQSKRIPKVIGWYKRPSLFMPKEAARVFLEVTNVRVERLQDITWEDIQKEGLITELSGIDGIQDFENKWIGLWQKIHDADSWVSNPWVWVYEFTPISKPKDFLK